MASPSYVDFLFPRGLVAPVSPAGAPVPADGAPGSVSGASVSADGAPGSADGVPVPADGAPVSAAGAPVSAEVAKHIYDSLTDILFNRYRNDLEKQLVFYISPSFERNSPESKEAEQEMQMIKYKIRELIKLMGRTDFEVLVLYSNYQEQTKQYYMCREKHIVSNVDKVLTQHILIFFHHSILPDPTMVKYSRKFFYKYLKLNGYLTLVKTNRDYEGTCEMCVSSYCDPCNRKFTTISGAKYTRPEKLKKYSLAEVAQHEYMLLGIKSLVKPLDALIASLT